MGTLTAAIHEGSYSGFGVAGTWGAVGGSGSGDVAKAMCGIGQSHLASWPYSSMWVQPASVSTMMPAQ